MHEYLAKHSLIYCILATLNRRFLNFLAQVTLYLAGYYVKIGISSFLYKEYMYVEEAVSKEQANL
jgi:hypothetical protein